MINLDTTKRAARMLEQGRVTVTFQSPSSQHITVRARCRKPGQNNGPWEVCPLAEAMVISFDVPSSTGADKIARYSRRKGFVPDRDADNARVWSARQLLRLVTGQSIPGALTVVEADRCGVCGRELTDPESIDRGIGPDCFGKLTGSKHETKKPAQQRLV